MSLHVKYIVRHIEPKDFEEVRQLWISTEFTIYKYSNEAMVEIDPKGIFVAQDHNGRIIGICSGVNLSEDLAFIGQYVVREECRGLGIGSALWKRTLDHIGNDRNISLIADPPMYLKYKEQDFKVDPHKSVLYFNGKLNLDHLTRSVEGISVKAINENNINQVIQYDRQVCDGLDRKYFIEQLIKNNCNKSAVAMDECNRVVGYCVLCLAVNEELRLEPLYADNQSVAELLVNNCCQSYPKSLNNLIYRSWDSHQQSLEIANKLGLHYWKKAHLLFTKKMVLGLQDKMFSPSNSTFFPF